MRVDRRYPTPSALTTREQVADIILDRLQGYVRRQGSVPHDRAYMKSLLDEWDRQVKDLQRQVKLLQAPRAPEKKARFGYLRFITGLTQCPTP